MKVEIANLPQGKVNLFVCADRKDLVSKLSRLGADVLVIKKSEIFNNCENDHPDMHLCHLGGKKIVVYKEDKYISAELLKRDFEVIYAKTEKSGKYPECAALNACFIGKILLCNIKAVDKAILEYAEKNGFKIIDCKQGYSRCSSLVISEKAVITDDISVYNALKDEIDVLLVSKREIKLGQRKDGFIGGCAGLVDKDIIAFYGNLSHYSDKYEIEAFLEKHGVKPLYLSEDTLCDVGTIIPLSQG